MLIRHLQMLDIAIRPTRHILTNVDNGNHLFHFSDIFAFDIKVNGCRDAGQQNDVTVQANGKAC